MKKNIKVLAIVPARGGSKSIPRKNIRHLGGVPLIAYSIEAAKQSLFVDRVIVSTDDKEIAEVATAWGAEVPFLRPADLAGDDVTDFPVFEHALRWLEFNENYLPDIVVQLRPTTPLRSQGLVDEAVEILLSNPNADCVRAIAPSGENPYKMWRLENGTMLPLMQHEFPEPYNMPRQQLPQTYWQTGHVEAIRYQTILQKRSLTGDTILPCLVPHELAIDLDNLYQWEMAEFLLDQGKLDVVLPRWEDDMPYHGSDEPDWAFKFFHFPPR